MGVGGTGVCVGVGGTGVAVGLARVGTNVGDGRTGVAVGLAVALAVGVAVASGGAVLVTSTTGSVVGDGDVAPGAVTTKRTEAVCTGAPPYAASVHRPVAAACGTMLTNLKWPWLSTVTVPRLIGAPAVDSAGLSSSAML
jgi:hypothetical protein